MSARRRVHKKAVEKETKDLRQGMGRRRICGLRGNEKGMRKIAQSHNGNGQAHADSRA